MKIGYACQTVGLYGMGFRSCIAKNATDQKLFELIEHNLNSLEKILLYNIKNNILLFRISSDIIPFGSSPVNTLDWQGLFDGRLSHLSQLIKNSGIRVSMHPGQYTVLNSPDPAVVERAVADLRYHCDFLNALRTDDSSKIILHIGGVYGNKSIAAERFVRNYQMLDESIKKRIALENDDRCFNIQDVSEIAAALKVPVVFDIFHDNLNPSPINDCSLWLLKCAATWSRQDGMQKIHYSQPSARRKNGAHSDTVNAADFVSFYKSLPVQADIMLEVKDKNLSAVKCTNCTRSDKKISHLEDEWAKYKYSILEHSKKEYLEIRNILKDKTEYPALPFYGRIENALRENASRGQKLDAALHVWGYFKNKACQNEKASFEKLAERFAQGKAADAALKRALYKLALKYNEQYLLSSYYFFL